MLTAIIVLMLICLFRASCKNIEMVESNEPYINLDCRTQVQHQTFEIDCENLWATVEKEYLSFAINAKRFARKNLKFISPKFMTLCSGLSQQKGKDSNLYLRVAGQPANKLIFQNDKKKTNFMYHKWFYMTPHRWDKLYEFISKLGWKLVFGLNALLRNEDGSWNSSNPLEIVEYIKLRGDKVDFELGNEPDLYKKGNVSLTVKQIANDFYTLKRKLSKQLPHSKLIGPDVSHTHDSQYSQRFLKVLKPNVLNAFSLHFYYGAGFNATLDDFLDPNYLDQFIRIVSKVPEFIKADPATNISKTWIGETADTYGGGAKGLSDTFAAGFLFMDKLGLAARLNVSVMVRQAIIGMAYALIDHNNNDFPQPCYWISALHKLLVGNKVLDVKGSLQLRRRVRLYAHCINEDGRHQYESGAIVALAVNLDKSKSASIQFDGYLQQYDIHQYLLEPPDQDLLSKYIALNGKVLDLVDDITMPTFEPMIVQQPFILPPVSYGFYVIPNAHADACK